MPSVPSLDSVFPTCWAGCNAAATTTNAAPCFPITRQPEALGIRWDYALGPHVAVLNLLEAFHHDHGHLRLPPSHTVDGLNLSAWLTRQRSDHHADTLNPELLVHLNALDPRWHHPPTLPC